MLSFVRMETHATSLARKVAALIPCYGEAAHVGGVIEQTLAVGVAPIVVDDGSPDDTADVARRAGAAKVIVHETNRGKGAAMATGLRHVLDAGYEAVVLLDGDGQHVPAEISRFLEAWRTGVVPEPLRGTAPDPAPWFGRESRGGADPFRDAFPLRLPVEVRLPRFRIESRASLVAPLRALGVATAFRDDGAADFSGVFERERRNLALADVRQAALVDVDEEGTTAAAATHAVGCGCASYSPTHMDFTVDRPFLFLLRAADDGPLLFAGVVFDAAAAQSGRPR